MLAASAVQLSDVAGIEYQHAQHNALKLSGNAPFRKVSTLTMPAVTFRLQATHGTGLTHLKPVQPTVLLSVIRSTPQKWPPVLFGRPNETLQGRGGGRMRCQTV